MLQIQIVFTVRLLESLNRCLLFRLLLRLLNIFCLVFLLVLLLRLVLCGVVVGRRGRVDVCELAIRGLRLVYQILKHFV